MATLDHFEFLLNRDTVKLLQQKNIRSVTDFLQENTEIICNITKLPFKNVLEIREKLLESCRGKMNSSYDFIRNYLVNRTVLTTGIEQLDNFFNGFEPGYTYEICGLSGTGKTQICLATAANIAAKEKCVYYIDTKGDFSAQRVKNIMNRNVQNKNIATCLERIRVNQIYTLHQLIHTLHWLKNQLLYDFVPLVIIDCISTAYFFSVGSDKPVGLGLLNHVASLLKYIAVEYRAVVLITNLAVKKFNRDKNTSDSTVKPCLGKYWFHVCHYRLNLRKDDFVTHVTIDQNSILPCSGNCSINLYDI